MSKKGRFLFGFVILYCCMIPEIWVFGRVTITPWLVMGYISGWLLSDG